MTVSCQCQSIQCTKAIKCTITGVFRQTYGTITKGKIWNTSSRKTSSSKAYQITPHTCLKENGTHSLLQTWRGWESYFGCAFGRKSKALGAAFNISSCFFTQPCAQGFQDSTASRPADLGLRFPEHLGFPSTQTAEYLQTFHFTWIDQLSLRTLGGGKENQPRDFRSFMSRQTLFQLLHSFVFSEKMKFGTPTKLSSCFMNLLTEVSFSLRHSQLGLPRFCRNSARIVLL